jgi:hypothetical protein
VKLVIGKAINPEEYSIRQVEELTMRLRGEIKELYHRHAGPGDMEETTFNLESDVEVARENS